MCGINGFISTGGTWPSNARALIADMNACIRHRGPDDEGVWINDQMQCALGHLRLSIIDLSDAGHQPMTDEKGNTIVFNGEIYNYAELKDKHPQFRYTSATDTEVLLKLYAAHGHEALKELNGMFAFAFADVDNAQLLLARDRIGKKPLYYSTMGGFFSFSSEIRSLLKLPWIKAETDDEALYHFLTFNQLSAPQTMFRHIAKLGSPNMNYFR